MDDTLDPSTRKSQLFAELSELHGEARREALSARTAEEPELRAQLEGMLALLELEPESVARHDAPRIGQGLPEGMIVAGRYRLVRPVGRGGISVVYLAQEVDGLRRQIALKLLMPGLEAAGLARFEGEKNALARMNHRNIARILDAGFTEIGQAFVAMEHIDGKPLDVYCREHALDLGQRLGLFVEVCHGVAHAHQKGIIHRDLKPTNVLVTTVEGGAHPKVIDFGIAKSMGHSLSGGPAATQLGFAVGTPGYMSPEQCAVDGRDIDTTADVYALGVILYELLTGSLPHVPPPPHRFDPSAFAQRLMNTRVEPMSARLASLRSGGADSKLGTVPAHIAPSRLAGDLDVIALKALSPSPEDRYHTVSELAADVERHLRGEPILARPPSLGYLLSSLLRRRKRVFIAASLGLLLIVALAFVMGSLVAAEREAVELAQLANERAKHEERVAKERAELARAASARGALASAQAAVEAGNAAAAHRSLASVPVDLRQWEWRWLSHASDQSELAIAAHRGGVRELALSRDEHILASHGEDGDVALWDVESGDELARFEGLGPPRFVRYGLAFSLELGVVVSSDHGHIVCATELATGAKLWCREGLYHLQAESLAADGRLALSTGDAVIMVDAITGHERSRFSTPSGADRAVFGDPELGELLVVHGGGRIYGYELDDPPRLLWWRRGGLDTLSHSRRLALTVRGAEFWRREVIDVATGELVTTVLGQPPSMPGSAIGPNGELLGSERGSVVARRSSFHDLARTHLLGHRAHVRIVRAFHGGFFAGDDEGAIRRWASDTPPIPSGVAAAYDTVFRAAYPGRGELLFTAGWGVVTAWDLGRGAEVWTRWVGRDYLLGLDAVAETVVAISVTGDLTRFDAKTGEHGPALATGLEASVLAHTNDGTPLVGTLDGEVVALSHTGAVRWRRTTHGAAIGQLAISPDGSLLAVGADRDERVPRHGGDLPARRDAQVLLLDPASGEVRRALEARGASGWLALSWSPDGRRLIGGGYQSELVIWELESDAPPRQVPAMGLEVRALGFTKDGERVFSADENGTVQLWSKDGDHVLTLPTRNSLVHDLFVLPNSALVVVNNTYPLVVYDPRESTPATRTERRAWGRSETLRAAVDRVWRQAVSADDLARLVAVMPDFEGMRTEALAMVEARGSNPNRLNSEVWEVVRYPGERRDAVSLARRRAEDYAESHPRWEFENTRAFARLRDEDFAGAKASAIASMRLGVERGVTGFPAECAILSLVASRSGRFEEARMWLERAEQALGSSQWQHDLEARSIVDEARQALVSLSGTASLP